MSPLRVRPRAWWWGGVLLLALGRGGVGPAGVRAEDAPSAPWAKDVAALTEGVKEIAAPGVPGAVAVWGDDAFPVVLGRTGRVERLPAVAAARLGKGRVVAFGHDGYLVEEAAATADTARLLVNAVRWAAGARAKAPRVLLARARLEKTLGLAGAEVAQADGPWVAELPHTDVLVANGALPEEALEDLRRWVAAGGGLLVAQTGWGWLQVTGADSLRENRWNRLLAPAGLAFAAATLERTGGQGLTFEGVPGRAFHAGHALDLLAQASRAAAPALRQASANATSAWPLLPREERGLRARVLGLVEQRRRDLVPTPEKPLKADRALERFLLAVDVEEREHAEPEAVRAHPSAEAFPGKVEAGARAVSGRVEVDLSVPGWHSTGLYAVAGRPLRVVAAPITAPPEAPDGAPRARLAVQIGCHTDELWHLDAWPRVPRIVTRKSLDDGETSLASAYGGLVYVVVEQKGVGRGAFEIGGAVEAPTYVRGVTGAEAWKKARRAPAPWGELVGRRVALSVPAEHLRTLEDPEALLAVWDEVLDQAADLAVRPRERERGERYVADVEISAGYMHSGYPIMTHLDAAPRMVDAALLTSKGDWGLFHELGHNHQQPEWTFEGTGEVTCNLWSLYLMERIAKRPASEGHEALSTREARTKEHLAKGAPFERWKADPFLALEMYVQLREAFGWDAYQAVFRAYRALPEAERPKDEAAKRDQWLVRTSRQVGRDLGPFFIAWGVPTGEAARAGLKDLPTWMPAGFPPR